MGDRAIIFIFDLDGVLIECKGYIRTIIETVQTLIRRMGFKRYSPDASSHALFESCGIGREWDTVAVWLAVLFKNIAGEHGSEKFPPMGTPISEGCLEKSLPNEISTHIFEDLTTGLQAGKRAQKYWQMLAIK
jgi:hypothetical protein